MDMLSIKVEPEDTPTWEERRIISEEHGTISGDAEKCVRAATESISSCLEVRLENEVKREESSDSSQETDGEVVTVPVTIQVEEAQFLTKISENGIGVVIKTEDTDLGNEGCVVSHVLHRKDHLIEPSVHHLLSQAETSSGKAGPFPSSSELIVSDGSSEITHSANKLAVDMTENQCQLSENSAQKRIAQESLYTHSMKNIFSQHQVIHPKGKDIFNRKQYCQKQEMTHTGEKALGGQHCEKSIAHKQKSNSQTLMKQFQCQFCEKSFFKRSNYKAHERTHTGERPFQCQFCEKSFASKATHKNHETTHTGIKRFKCQFCEKSFSRKRDCRRHEQIHKVRKCVTVPVTVHVDDDEFLEKAENGIGLGYKQKIQTWGMKDFEQTCTSTAEPSTSTSTEERRTPAIYQPPVVAEPTSVTSRPLLQQRLPQIRPQPATPIPPTPQLLPHQRRIALRPPPTTTRVTLREELAALKRETAQVKEHLNELCRRQSVLERKIEQQACGETIGQSLHILSANHTNQEVERMRSESSNGNSLIRSTSLLTEEYQRNLSGCEDHRQVARQLARIYFTDEERARSNCNGVRKPALDIMRLTLLRKDLFSIVQTPLAKQATVWKSVTAALDAEMRSKAAYLRRKSLY